MCASFLLELCSSAVEDDDAFSELGPGTSEVSAKKLNLVTEKRDHFSVTFTILHICVLANDFLYDLACIIVYFLNYSCGIMKLQLHLLHYETSWSLLQALVIKNPFCNN